ncbi:MAG TPA: methylated-DNA--[protein]-cysteine S-methyltransferase [Candidatus Binataceae bacterium]|nr:methylated-DNA--[protein]-cysteine S-methyltransferase [Candidatus Binataceae bacterium]
MAQALAWNESKIKSSAPPYHRVPAELGELRTAVGPMLAVVGEQGLAMLQYLYHRSFDPALARARARLAEYFDLQPASAHIARLQAVLSAYFDGSGELQFPIDWRLIAGKFNRRALAIIQGLPVGTALTYRDLAAQAGSPAAPRAAGNAMHTNPIAIFLPCHRVIGSNGSLTGYAGGLEIKRALLRHEGFTLSANDRLLGAVWGDPERGLYCEPSCARRTPAQWLIFCGAPAARKAGLSPCPNCHPLI